ncbi:VG15 protein [Williamsia serinedens]|uniref:Capsid maturation protease n=1 Tax=Williamsia serinedens TaxID=391736 RepID=A0ABT1H8R8_9NOCA|nr:hypothetical protein [Williamsia serinedens]MCP2163107.1 hypothetical protein [Williamsia serinedens]
MATTAPERQQILSQVNTVAVNDLVDLWRRASNLSSEEFRTFILDAFPDVADPYAAMAAQLAADWYDESAPNLAYQATPTGTPNVQALRDSTKWALGAYGDAGLARLAGTLQRAVFNGARDTIIDNAAREQGARWARHASANACEFCRLLATRGAAYGSRDKAMKAHDHCHCVAIEVRPGSTYEPAPYVAEFEQQYNDARRAAGSGDLTKILAAMRQQ